MDHQAHPTGLGEARRRSRRPAWADIRLVLLFVLIYGAFGIQSPFFPVFLKQRGIDSSTIGLMLAAGTGIKLVSAPVLGRVADRLESWSGVLAAALFGCAVTSIGLISSTSPIILGGVIAMQSLFLGPVPTIADALALNAGQRISYAFVRGAGAGAFILFLTVSGRMVERFGITSIFIANALLNLLAAMFLRVRGSHRQSIPSSDTSVNHIAALKHLAHIRVFRLVIFISGLILGSHALHDAFSVVRWTEAGMSPSTVGLLWSMAVSSEVLVFFFVGPPLLRMLGPAGVCTLSAVAATLRWAVMATTTSIPALLIIQPLHGITFALLHLACMRLITISVPVHLAATAQGVCATFGAGLASVIVTSVSGFLFARFGAGAFWLMSLLSATAMIPAWQLRRSLAGLSSQGSPPA